MRALRVLSLVSLLAVGVTGSAMAQRITAPGTYPVKICVAPGFLPDMGASLPAELQAVDDQVYSGDLTVSLNGSQYSLRFQGERADGAKLIAQGTFSSDWTGFLLGTVPVGSVMEPDCVVSINVASLLSGRINGVGSFDGSNQRLLAFFGAGGVVDRFKLLRAPGPFQQQ